MRIHFPSLVAGVLLAGSFAMFMAADRPVFDMGRYDLQTNEHRAFVIDRQTGKVWMKYVTANNVETDHDFSQAKLGK